MACIYKRSKYYAEATLEPQDIVEPIGYKFLNEGEEKKAAKPKKYGEVKNLFLVDKSLIRKISSFRMPAVEVMRNLKVSESARKNFYMNGSNTEALTKDSTSEMIQELRSNFFKNSSSQQQIEYLELMILLNSSEEVFRIKDYALSTYFVYYHGENKRFYKQLESIMLSEFLEYDNEIIISSPKLSRPQLRRITNYENVQEIEEYIREINEIGKEKDSFYSGVHLFISDTLPECRSASFAQEEKEFWPYLQFTILVLMSTLAEGQHAIIRVKGTFTHKTSEYIFLLKMAFKNINFQKNIISNPFSHDKYVICEYFSKQNGKIIAEYLINNYSLLFKYQDERLLVDPKVTFTQDFQKNIATYNDSTPVMRIKEISKEYHENSNISIYPNKEALLKKIGELKIREFNDHCLAMESAIPNPVEKKEEPKVKQIVEKQAAVDINISQMFQISSKPKKRTQDALHDISKKKEGHLDTIYSNYLSLGDKSIKEKKEKSKKKKPEREDDM